MRKLGALIAVAAFGLSAAQAEAANCIYFGPAGGNWAEPSHWTCVSPTQPPASQVPTGADRATVGSGRTVAVTSFAPAGHVTLTEGATITLANSATLLITAADGLDGGLDVGQATIKGTGKVSVVGPFNQAGSATDTLSVLDGARLALGGGGAIDSGQLCLGSGTLELSSLLTVDIPWNTCPGGLIKVFADGELRHNAAGSSAIMQAVDNRGVVRAHAGSLELNGGTTGPGKLIADDNAATLTLGDRAPGFPSVLPSGAALEGNGTGKIAVAGPVTLQSGATVKAGTPLVQTAGMLTLEGPGSVSLASFRHDGGELNSARDVTVAAYSSGSGVLKGAHTFEVTSTFDKTAAGPSGQTRLADGVRFILGAPTASFDTGAFCLGTGEPVFVVNGVLTLDGTQLPCSGGSIIVNPSGEIHKPSAGTLSVLSRLDNDGTVRVDGGTLSFNGGSAVGGLDDGLSNGRFEAAGIATTLGLGGGQRLGSSASLTTSTGAGLTTTGGLIVDAGATFAPTGALVQSGDLQIGGTGSISLASFNQVGGVLTSTRHLTTGSYTHTSGALLGAIDFVVTGPVTNVNGGEIRFGNTMRADLRGPLSLDNGRICVETGSALAVGGLLTVADGSESAFLNCSGSVTIFDGGEVRITATAPRQANGPVLLTGGTLTVPAGRNLAPNLGVTATSGTVAIDGTLGGALTLDGPAVLTGSGTVPTVHNLAGTVRPGSPLGTLTVPAHYAQQSGGTLEVQIGGASPGTQHDVLAAGGALDLGGKIRYVQANDFVPPTGSTYAIVTSSTAQNQTATLTGDPLPLNKAYLLSYPESSPFGARLTVIGDPDPVVTPTPTATATPTPAATPVATPTPSGPPPAPTTVPTPPGGASTGELALARLKGEALATRIGLPAARSCVRRTFTFKLKKVSGVPFRKVTATINGKRITVRATRGTFSGSFKKALPKRFTVTVTITLPSGRALRAKRGYRRC